MKKSLLLFLAMFVSVFVAKADTYTHTFSKGEITTEGSTVTLSGFDWNSTAANSIGWNNTGRGLQVGSKTSAQTSFQLSSSAFSAFTIKSVTVNASIAASGDAKMTIKAGDKTSSEYTLTTAATDYTFECDGAKGDIVINWTATQRAYYIKSISIEYTMPASMVTVPAPVFMTPEGVYVDRIKNGIYADVKEEQNAVLYYTTDGTTPDPADESGSTICTRTWALYISNVSQSMTVKALAALDVDGTLVLSDIAEATYIVSPKSSFVASNSIVSGSKYAIVAADSVANPFIGNTVSGYLNSAVPTSIYDGHMETAAYNAFTITAVSEGYTIQDAENRYLYINPTNNLLEVSEQMPAEGAIWDFIFNADDQVMIINIVDGDCIYYSFQNDNFGCYTESSDVLLPTLYLMPDYSYTITPEQGSEHESFQTISITCPQGIKATEGFKATTTVNNVSYTLNCVQADANTLNLTFDEPLVVEHSLNLMIYLSGSLILDPNGVQLYKDMSGIRLDYILKGQGEAATIEKVTPENNSTLPKLYYFLFTFSWYASPTENEEIVPRLYKEGTTTLIPVEYTTENEEGNGFIAMMDGAIRVLEAVTESGTYILEIPDGYFESDGKAVKGVTLKYNLVYDPTGIDDVIAEGENGWVVYNISGVKVMETKDAQRLESLPKGLYIINGVKTIIK